MNVVDSSAWLEYFADGPNAGYFAEAIENEEALVVPAITLFEVYKRVFTQRGEEPAWQAVTAMQAGRVVDVNASLALAAARISADHRLPMADNLILTKARAYSAVLWTQDSDFEGFQGVNYKARKA